MRVSVSEDCQGVVVMDEYGQGALEYLLLIAGALLVAAVVIYLLGDITGKTKGKIEEKLEKGLEEIAPSGEST